MQRSSIHILSVSHYNFRFPLQRSDNTITGISCKTWPLLACNLLTYLHFNPPWRRLISVVGNLVRHPVILVQEWLGLDKSGVNWIEPVCSGADWNCGVNSLNNIHYSSMLVGIIHRLDKPILGLVLLWKLKSYQSPINKLVIKAKLLLPTRVCFSYSVYRSF